VLDQGRVIASGPKHDLFENPRTVVAARLTGCKNIVPAIRVSRNRVSVPAWNCELATLTPISSELTNIGVRSHHVQFVENKDAPNVFPCWLAYTSEAPHEMTLYLRLHAPPSSGASPHLQADIPKSQWQKLSAQPQPWNIQLDAEKLLLLHD
jgi:molybdate transport system permease protein